MSTFNCEIRINVARWLHSLQEYAAGFPGSDLHIAVKDICIDEYPDPYSVFYAVKLGMYNTNPKFIDCLPTSL